jgi:hypothetical protein
LNLLKEIEMSDRSKNMLKFLGMGVLWVYILSIRVGQNTVFHYANDILVKNQIVEAIDRQLGEAANGVSRLASDGFARLSGRSKGM